MSLSRINKPFFLNLLRDLPSRLIIVALFVLIWEVIVRSQAKPILPPPSQCVQEMIVLFFRGELLFDCLASLKRVLIGFTLALAAGLIFGYTMGIYPRFKNIFSPLIETLRPIPPIAWIPISIVLFKLGDPSSYFVIFIGAFFPILTNSMLGAREVLPVYLEAAQTLGASRWVRFKHVIWPSSLPSIFAGIRTGLGFSWMCVVAAEMIAARSGLGYMIQYNRQALRLDRVVAGMMVIGIIGFIMNRLMQYIEQISLPWRFVQTSSSESDKITFDPYSAITSQEIPNISTKADEVAKDTGGSRVLISDLSFGYIPNLKVISCFNLSVAPGEVIGIIGPSGCGKTTVLRILAGLESDYSGLIEIDSKPLIESLADVTMIFQGLSLFPWKTALSNVTFSLAQTTTDSFEDDNALAFLDMVKLRHKAANYPNQLSGGQQQRIAVARALANAPKLLLMDEPFTALDSHTREALQVDVSDLLHMKAVTSLIVTHDIAEALYMSDRVIVMTADGGKIATEVLVETPRPRQRAFRFETKTIQLHDHLWAALREETKRNISFSNK
jgi:ABC-type nitrate/sulfonate/bicarbonate transport system permease component/ABC-type nitrate/sulfonate/bicarbonate transport system ATPase subunit